MSPGPRPVPVDQGEISAGPVLDALVGPVPAGSVVVVTGTSGTGVTTFLRHVATQIGQHRPVWFVSNSTEPPRPIGPPADIVWMHKTSLTDLAMLTKRSFVATVWIVDDGDQMLAGDGALASKGWASLLPRLQANGVTLFLGMKQRRGPDRRLPHAIPFMATLGLELDVVVRTQGNDSVTGVVADVKLWKSKLGPAQSTAGRVWIRPLHEPSVRLEAGRDPMRLSSPEIEGFLG